VMSVQGNSREVEVSKEEVWEDLENKAPSMGPGVVRIHLITLQCQTFTRDRYFKLGPHIDPGHIRINYPDETSKLLDTELGEFGKRLDEERTVLRGKARNKIMEKMTEKATELAMTFSSKVGGTKIIESFKHIILAWQQDNGSSDMKKSMHSVTVGCFEKNWDQTMESELMKTCNMKYDVITSGRSKGCISVLFSYERSKLLKRLNRRDSLNKIRVSRTHQERQVQGVTSRKKARVFLEPLEV
jgi:hypothetical protein